MSGWEMASQTQPRRPCRRNNIDKAVQTFHHGALLHAPSCGHSRPHAPLQQVVRLLCDCVQRLVAIIHKVQGGALGHWTLHHSPDRQGRWGVRGGEWAQSKPNHRLGGCGQPS